MDSSLVCRTCYKLCASRKVYKLHLLRAHQQYILYGCLVPQAFSEHELERRLKQLARDQGRKQVRWKTQDVAHPCHQQEEVAEGHTIERHGLMIYFLVFTKITLFFNKSFYIFHLLFQNSFVNLAGYFGNLRQKFIS